MSKFVPTPRLVSLYREGLTLRQVAERVGITHQAVWERFVRTGIELRPRTKPPAPPVPKPTKMPRLRKHPEIADLKVGDSLLLERPRRKGRWQGSYYRMAARIGIKLKVEMVNTEHVRLTRVE